MHPPATTPVPLGAASCSLGPCAAPDALDFHVETHKAVDLLAHRARTRRRVQPSACAERGTPAAVAWAAAGRARRQTPRVAPHRVTAAAPRVRGRVAPAP
jgi:hypothetical protein